MRLRNKYIVLFYRLLFLTVCGYGLYVHSGLPEGALNPKMLLYYTILSNLVCFIYILCCFIKNIRQFKSWDSDDDIYVIFPRTKGAITMCITITFLVYHFVLAPTIYTMYPTYNVFGLNDLIVHYFVPGMMILDWILFDKKNIFRKTEPILWLALPYAYLIFALVRGYFGGPIQSNGSKYPYFFLDIDVLGIGGVSLYVGGLTLLALILGYIILLIDKGLNKIKFTKREKEVVL